MDYLAPDQTISHGSVPERGNKSALNIAAATLIPNAKRIFTVSVSVAGAVGTVNDCATVGAAAASNQIGVIPAAIGIYSFDFPIGVALVIVPGAAQVAAVSYS